MACPYGAIARDNRGDTAVKCDRCPGRDIPACVASCPNNALFFLELQGKTAAFNMTGRTKKAAPLLGMQNAVEFREVPAIAVGLSKAGPAPELEILTFHQPSQGVYRKIVLQENVIKGMIFVGEKFKVPVWRLLSSERKQTFPALNTNFWIKTLTSATSGPETLCQRKNP